MTEADIKIAVYTDAMRICDEVKSTYGPLPGCSCDSIKRELSDRIREIIERQIHELAVAELG